MPRDKRARYSDRARSAKKMRKTQAPRAVLRNGSFKSPRIIQFKRSTASQVTLSTTSPPSGWTANNNGVVQPFVTGLSNVPDNTEFVALFDTYRIKGVRLQGYLSSTNSHGTENQNVMMYICPNHMGVTFATDLTEQWFLDRPRTKKIPLMNTEGKSSFDEYLPLSQLSNTYVGGVDVDYALVAPKFLSTSEPNTPHYGAMIRLQRMDDAAMDAASPITLKLVYTWYLEMRGVA